MCIFSEQKIRKLSFWRVKDTICEIAKQNSSKLIVSRVSILCFGNNKQGFEGLKQLPIPCDSALSCLLI